MNNVAENLGLALTEQPQQVAAPALASQLIGDIMLNVQLLQQVQVMAELMANSKATIPMHLRGNVGDCYAVIMQAIQWRMNPWAVAQKTHLVNGVLGYEAQLVNAVIIAMAPTLDRLHYEWFGDWGKILGKFKEVESRKQQAEDGTPKKYRVPDWDINDEQGLGVRVWSTLKGESEPRELTLLMTQARTRNSTLWTDDPRQQLAYLGVKRWSRLYCPDVILGVYTPDELEEPRLEARDVTPRQQTSKLPPYPAEEFKKNLPQWRALVENGRRTADDVIATVSARFTLSDEQFATIRSFSIAEVIEQ